MSVNERIQWLHKKVSERSFPNAMRLSEKFDISHRQAQRDVDYLKKKLSAPLEYNAEHRGYYYKTEFTLPSITVEDNDEDLAELNGVSASDLLEFTSSEIQMTIPYSATLEIPDKLTALELNSFIVSKEGKNRYICEFHNITKFIGLIMVLDSNIKVIEPDWIREKMITAAENILKNNK